MNCIILKVTVDGLTAIQLFEDSPESLNDELAYWKDQQAEVEVIQSLERSEARQ